MTVRKYVRTENWSVTAKASKDADGEQWFDAQVEELSAGGLLFETELFCKKGDTLRFDLEINPLMPGITDYIQVKAKGLVKSVRERHNDLLVYGVEFSDISNSDQIRLDELVQLTIKKYMLDSDAPSLGVQDIQS